MFSTFEKFQNVMRSSHKILRRHLEPYGLYRGQPKILSLLSKHQGLSKKEIATYYHLSMPTVTKTIERLEHNGFVYGKVDEMDRRKNRVFLTEKGQLTNLELVTFKKHYAEIVFKDVSKEDIEVMHRVLDQMQSNILEYKEKYEKAD